MSDTLTSLIGSVTYRPDEPMGDERREWLYVVSETGDTLSGVAFTNTESNPRSAWVTIPRNSTRADDDATGYGMVRHPLTAVSWWPEMVATFFQSAATATTTEAPTAPSAEALAEEYRRGVRETEERHQRFLDVLVSDAHVWADENSLCSEFDRFMDEHGLPGRTRAYRVTLDVSASVTVYVDASSEDEAADLATDMFQSDPMTYATDLNIDVSDVERDD